MKKDMIICFKDGEMLCVSGTSAEDGISEMSTEEWIVCADMYGKLYTIDNESIKYIKIAPHEEGGRYAEKHD